MIAALAYTCCLFTATDADNVAWRYDASQRILDTQLITTADTTLLAVLQADRKLLLLDPNTSDVLAETSTPYSMLKFAESIPTATPADATRITLSTLGGCQAFTLNEQEEHWQLVAEPFIPVIDPELPKADPEFNDRLLGAWQAGDSLLTLTTRGRLVQHDLARHKPAQSRQLPVIGALRHATAPHQLAIAYKHRATVSLSVINAFDIDQTLTITLPEATIPRQLTLNAAVVVAHYTDRAYALPLIPMIRCWTPLWLIEDWPAPTHAKPPQPAEFNAATQQHALSDAIILVADEWIVRLNQP